MIKVKVVFQGGGAKLVTLMAAASVLQDLELAREIKIERVVGVSAGAIAACMLASRHPLENYRLRAKDAGGKVMDQIENFPKTLSLFLKTYSGRPLLPEKALRDFCRNVFSVNVPNKSKPETIEQLERIGQLPIAISIVTASVRHTEKIVYHSDRDDQKRIEDALCDSCAIPFVFRTFKDHNFIVDGGVCGNLPDCEVLGEKDDAFVLGFGFGAEQSEVPSDAFEYAKVLVATAMTSAVHDSMERIRRGMGEVCELPQDFGTFDFKAALEQGLSQENYQKVRDKIRPQILNALHKFRERVQTTEDETILRKKFLAVYKQQISRFPYIAERSAMLVTANSSRSADDPLRNEDDDVMHIVDYRPKNAEMTCLRVGLARASPPPLSGESDYQVETKDGKLIPAIQVLASDEYKVGRDKLQSFYALFFLEQPVSTTVRITLRTTQKNAMSNLGEKSGMDWLRSHNPSDTVTFIDLLLIYPGHFTKITLLDLAENVDLLPADQQPLDIPKMKEHWSTGRKMSEAEISPYIPHLAPKGCKVTGWRADKVDPGHFCGVVFRRD